MGDWSGQGKATVGVVDPGSATWYLRNSNSSGPANFAPFGFARRDGEPWLAIGTSLFCHNLLC